MNKSSNGSLLQARNLHKTYRLSRRNVVRALRGVDITVDAGEMVAIMGPSGCGKSTLMHILGLLQPPDRDANPLPTIDSRRQGGFWRFQTGERTRIRASTMGFVFQTYNLLPMLTAAENVALAAEYAGQARSKARAAATEALHWVGLAERGRHRPAELSGGEHQRVAIARALVEPAEAGAGRRAHWRPRLGEQRTEVIQLLRRFNREQGQTIILVTHDPEVGAECSRIVKMRDGALEHGTPAIPGE